MSPGRRPIAKLRALPFDSKSAILHLTKADAAMGKLIKQVGDFGLKLDETDTPFEALAESIVYQQLTGKAASTIYGRVQALYGGKLGSPKQIVKTSDKDFRAAGLSAAKTAALKDLAVKQSSGLLPSLEDMQSMGDDEIVERLVTVRGIGRWTAEMLLIFYLGRPDVLPVNDYGVRKGFMIAYKKGDLPTTKELAQFGERWRPFRTVSSWYLWRATDTQVKQLSF